MINYQTVDIDTLIEDLRKRDLQNSKDSVDHLNDLKLLRRYRTDLSFKVAVDIFYLTSHAVLGHYHEVINTLKTLSSQAIATEQSLLIVEMYFALGYAYSMFNMMDQSILAFLNLIEYSEKERYITDLVALAYNNIGANYNVLNDADKALSYYLKCQNFLDDHYEVLKKAAPYQLRVLSELTMQYLKRGNQAKAAHYFNRLAARYDETYDNITKRMYHEAHVMYYGTVEQYTKMQAHFEDVRRLSVSSSDYTDYIKCFNHYYLICKNNKLSPSYFLEYLIEIDYALDDRVYYYHVSQFYRHYIDYYQSSHNDKQVTHGLYCLANQLDFIETHNKEHTKMLLEIQMDNQARRQENELIKQKNQQLNMLNGQLIASRTALQLTNQRVQTITEIGQNLTASLELNEVVILVYNHITRRLDCDVFILAHVNDKEDALITELFYQYGYLVDNVNIALDNEQSLLVRSFKQNRMIFSGDVQADAAFSDIEFMYSSGSLERTVMFIPLRFGEVTIGVITVQSTKVNAFSEADIAYVDSLAPYLAIAVNNALRSKQLKQEIRSHQATQLELEKLNNSLENLSRLDGLTQVYNRRAFEEESIELIERAAARAVAVHVYMIDIDHFKNYNDRYGHLIGDEALIAVAKRINRAFDGDNNVFARFGGEEFIALEIDLSLAEAEAKAEEIRRDIYNLDIEHADTAIGRLTVSIGLASSLDADVAQRSTMMKLADRMLYSAKDEGRNIVKSGSLNQLNEN